MTVSLSKDQQQTAVLMEGSAILQAVAALGCSDDWAVAAVAGERRPMLRLEWIATTAEVLALRLLPEAECIDVRPACWGSWLPLTDADLSDLYLDDLIFCRYILQVD